LLSIFHCDLKGDNIFYDYYGLIYLINFGSIVLIQKNKEDIFTHKNIILSIHEGAFKKILRISFYF
jgi:hypothetical protein